MKEPGTFYFPTTGIRARQAVLLAIDDVSLPLKKNLCHYITKPKVRPRPVLRPSRGESAPDNLAAHFYGTVLFDRGRFRMWYYALHRGINPDWPVEARGGLEPDCGAGGPLCYAESKDGIHWEKPCLNQLLFRGSRKNNALKLPDAFTAAAAIIRDEEDPDPKRRYKMVYERFWKPGPGEPKWGNTMRTATSPDGLDWSFGPKQPVQDAIEHSSFYKFNGLYIVNAQCGTQCAGEGGTPRGRQGSAWISTDFDHWLQESAESFHLPEPQDARKRGWSAYAQAHLGVGPVGYGNVMVGLYCRWHNNPDFHKISGDLGLVVSNDGLAFRELVKGHTWLSSRESLPVDKARSYPNVLCQASGILNVGEETRIYHGRWRNAPPDKGYHGEVALAVLPRDRWGALGLFPKRTQKLLMRPVQEGSVWTLPVSVPKCHWRVFLNADGANGMRVEVADERFNLLRAYAEKNSGTCKDAAGLHCAVKFREDLMALRGKTVRFRIHLKKNDEHTPRLYAVYLECHK